MTDDQKADICVVGGGAGGVTLAAAAAQLGAKTILVEKGQLGGDNLHRGTVPSKALIAAARHAYSARQMRGFGVSPLSPSLNFRAIAEHVQAVITSLSANESAERLAGFGVEVVRGFAKFEDRETVSVGERKIAARNFVIATGSGPAIPAIDGINRVAYLTNETLFGNIMRFDHLVVLGGSGTALEMAQTYLRLGCRVSLICRGKFLPEYDAELSEPLITRLREEGVVLAEGVTCDRMEPTDSGGVRVHVSKAGEVDTVDASHLLILEDRKPNIAELGLEVAGVTVGAQGIQVSSAMRTSNRQVHAIGDVTGGPPYAALARHQADVVLRRLVSGTADESRPEALPIVIFTDPELAHVGMTETAARATHGDGLRILRWPFSHVDRAVAERRTEGFAKIVTTTSGRILGATIIGGNAGELIATWSLAISAGLTAAQVARSLAPYPTFAETSFRAVQGFTTERPADLGLRGVLQRMPGFR